MVSGVPNRVDLVGSYAVRIDAVLNSGRGRLMNVSTGGAYVATTMNLLPQAQVKLRIIVPELKRWIDTEAIVAWENRGKTRQKDLPPGYGVRFIKVSEETALALQALLGGVSAPKVAPEPQPLVTPPVTLPKVGTARIRASIGVLDRDDQGPPYRLTKESIRAHVPGGMRGLYVLSYDRTQDTRVGRADDDLRKRLLEFVGEYAYFYFEPIEATDRRFFRECEMYHRLGGDHGQLDNTTHPAEPAGSELTCPVCGPRHET